MSHPGDDDSTRDDHSLGAVIAAYLRAARSDRKPDRAEVLARHPALVEDLESFFAEYDAFDRMASPLREIGREILLRSVASTGRLDPIHLRTGPISAPRDFGDFELGQVLGSGGMGVVYEARQRSMNRPVALKMIHGGEWASVADVQRFRTEVESIARLAHPHIVPIYEVGEGQGHHYYSMPLMGGGSLAGQLDRLKGDPKASARLMIEVARAVEYAHRRGIIHRDLKPSNILLDDAGRPHVSDFGLARRIGEESSLTGTGDIIGSPPYMAPEQAAGRSKEVTTATDVYGLGAIFYALLTGRPPFQGPSSLDVLEQVRQRDPDRPRSIDRRINAELETIALKCLEKEPNRRYAGAADLADDLERWLDGRTILARRSGPARRLAKWSRRHPVVALMTGLLVVGVPTAFAVTYNAYRSSERGRLALDASLYRANTALAEREIGAGNVDRAEELLLECPERLRGWEWQLLLQRSRRGPMSLATPGDMALSVAFSPDGRHLAVGHHEPVVRIWDPSTGRELSRIGTRSADTNCLAFSPDGGRLAGASMTGALEVWDPSTGRSLWGIADGQGRWALAFSPDGRVLATARFDRTIRLLDSATGEEFRSLAGHADRVTGVAFRPDGRRLASSSDDGSIKLWEADSGRELRTIRDGLSLPLRRVEFSPNGRFLAAGSVGGSVVAWDAETGLQAFRGPRHANEIHDLAFSPDGTILASAGADATIKVIDSADGRERITLRGQLSNVYGVAFSPDGGRLASASLDGTVRIWDAHPWEPEDRGRARILGKTGGFADDVAFSPDGRLVAATGRDQFLISWDLPGGRKLDARDAGAGSLRCLNFDPTGRYVAVAGFGKAVQLIDLARDEVVASLGGHVRSVLSLAFDPTGQLLASGGEDRVLLVWDVAGRAPIHNQRCDEGFVGAVAFSPDSFRVAAAAGGAIYVVEPLARRLVIKLNPGPSRINGLDYSPDGRRLALAGMDGTIRVLLTADWSEERSIRRPGVEQADVKFSPDGRLLATCGVDRLVQIWDAGDGRELFTLRDCVAPPRRLAFSRDGHHLAAAGGDRSIRVWDLTKKPFAAGSAPKGGPTPP